MLKYVVKRILIFIPTLIVISILTFAISINTPGDPVEGMLTSDKSGDESEASHLNYEKSYRELRKQLHLDLPLFYCSVTSATCSDTLYKIPFARRRETLERLSYNYGSWENVAAYYNSIVFFENVLLQLKTDSIVTFKKNVSLNLVSELYLEKEHRRILELIDLIHNELKSAPAVVTEALLKIKKNSNRCDDEKSVWKRYVPRFNWYASNNQYHVWLLGSSFDNSKGILRGDFGISYTDKRPVSGVLFDALKNTVVLSILSIILAYIASVPLGVYAAVNRGTKKEKYIGLFLFVLYSLPVFWIATVLMIFLCGGDYLSLFPAPGAILLPDDAPVLYKLTDAVHKSILPLFCWTYSSLAFISRQMRGAMLEELNKDYIRTAIAKGLGKKEAAWKHAFRNSLLPIITLFASIFPAAVSGSFVIEFIFQIPGMGLLVLESLASRNYPVIFSSMMLISVLTLFGILLADILYSKIDPRISFGNKKTA